MAWARRSLPLLVLLALASHCGLAAAFLRWGGAARTRQQPGQVRVVGAEVPVCVFDLDGTLLCGHDPAAAVRACVSKGYQITINTNRGRELFQEPLRDTVVGLGFSEALLASNLTQWAEDWKRKTFRTVPVRKVYNMEALARETGVEDKKCLILFDDEPGNIETVGAAGYSVQKVWRDGQCGTTARDIEDAFATLTRDCPAAAGAGRRPRRRRIWRAGGGSTRRGHAARATYVPYPPIGTK